MNLQMPVVHLAGPGTTGRLPYWLMHVRDSRDKATATGKLIHFVVNLPGDYMRLLWQGIGR